MCYEKHFLHLSLLELGVCVGGFTVHGSVFHVNQMISGYPQSKCGNLGDAAGTICDSADGPAC